MMKLTDYLHKLETDKNMMLEDRVLYLYDTRNNQYFTKVIVVSDVDSDGAIYKFAGDDPYCAYEDLNVIRAYTITNCLNVLMGLESLQGNYGESEVE